MTTLVLGASGATGKLLVEQLLNSGHRVKIVVRPSGNIPDRWISNDKLTIIKKNITEISVTEMSGYLEDCQAVASCLGHNLSLKGIYGKPPKLVTDAVKLMCGDNFKNGTQKSFQICFDEYCGQQQQRFK
jgi:putative NADH-flavin reductase